MFPLLLLLLLSCCSRLVDLLVTLKKIFCALTIYPAQVQGDNAAKELQWRISCYKANHDALILCRGGGSIEDLCALNDETLAMTIFHAKTPTYAVGHETDWTICDEVSDVRAATPTQAALILTPDMQQLHDKLVTPKIVCIKRYMTTLIKTIYWSLLVQTGYPLSIINEQQQQILLRLNSCNMLFGAALTATSNP